MVRMGVGRNGIVQEGKSLDYHFTYKPKHVSHGDIFQRQKDETRGFRLIEF